jgi:hypothetical protein
LKNQWLLNLTAEYFMRKFNVYVQSGGHKKLSKFSAATTYLTLGIDLNKTAVTRKDLEKFARDGVYSKEHWSGCVGFPPSTLFSSPAGNVRFYFFERRANSVTIEIAWNKVMVVAL